MEKKQRDPKLVTFGHRVRAARDGAGLTQAEVTDLLNAAGVHVPATAVAKVETGTRPTTVVELEALAAVLGVEPAQLLTGSAVDLRYSDLLRFRRALEARAELLEALATYRRRRELALEGDENRHPGLDEPLELVAAVVNGWYDADGHPAELGD